MGAIEGVRNYVLSKSPETTHTVLTVSPGYWRARTSFEGMWFKIVDVKTACNDFAIDESNFIKRAVEIIPSIVYLSLPNNPTGALFDPILIIKALTEVT